MGSSTKFLRQLGIANRIEACSKEFNDLGDVILPLIANDEGPTDARNLATFLKATDRIATATARVCPEDFVIALGGECSFVVGSLAGFRERFSGNPSILWLDSHGDFNTPDTTPSGFIGGMCLALACGDGPKLTKEVEKNSHLVAGVNCSAYFVIWTW